MQELTVRQAMAMLNVSQQRVNALIKSGRIKARPFGKAWAINARSLEKFSAGPRKAGRPKKSEK